MFFEIFLNIIVPLFIIIGSGVILDRIFKLDTYTLSKLNFYLFVPALVFIKIIEINIDLKQMFNIAAFTIIFMAVLFAVSYSLFSLKPFLKTRTVLSMGSIFTNCGNFGIPFMLLCFGNQSINLIAIIVIIQNFLTFTFGIWLFERKKGSFLKVFSGFLKVPVIYAAILGWVFYAFNIKLIPQIKIPLSYLSDGLIPLALLTLGVELSRSRISKNILPVSVIAFIRLIAGPLLAALLIYLFNFDNKICAMLIVSAGLPVGVNVYVMACEYKDNAQLASQTIFWTTILSAVTLSAVFALIRY